MNFKQIIFGILFCISLTSCKNGGNDGIIRIKSADEFQKQFQSESQPQLIDVRTPAEFSEGHIAGAKNINFKDSTFIQQVEVLDKDQPVYLYCRSGNRSSQAAEQMKEAGFKKIYHFEGGILEWNEEGKELVKE